MAEFTVSEVIDGDTFKVKEGCKWSQRIEDTVLACLRAARTGRLLDIILQKRESQDTKKQSKNSKD